MCILQVPFDMSKDWKQEEEAGYWDTEHCVSEDWKQEEETGYWDTEHCVSEDFVNDWKATEESGT